MDNQEEIFMPKIESKSEECRGDDQVGSGCSEKRTKVKEDFTSPNATVSLVSDKIASPLPKKLLFPSLPSPQRETTSNGTKTPTSATSTTLAPRKPSRKPLGDLRMNSKEMSETNDGIETKIQHRKKLGLLGVSVHHLRTVFLKEVCKAGYTKNSNIYDIQHGVIRKKGANMICPIDGKVGTSYINTLSGADNVGKANRMLSYTWGYEVGEIIETLERHCESNGEDPKRIYVWICCLCINQHRVDEQRVNGKNLSFEELRTTFSSKVSDIGHMISMMYPWNKPKYLERAWCVFELHEASTCKTTKVTIDMPPEERRKLVNEILAPGEEGTECLVTKFFSALGNTKVEETKATVEEDKKRILNLIKDFKKFDLTVNGYIREWAIELILDEVKLRSQSFSDIRGPRSEELLETCVIEEHAGFLTSIGHFLYRIGEVGRAIEVLEKCYKHCNDYFNNGHISIANSRNNIGNLFVVSQCRLNEALVHYTSAMEIYQEMNHVDMLKTLHGIGNIYQQQGKISDALEKYHEALDRSKSFRESQHCKKVVDNIELSILFSCANVLYDQGFYEKALEKYRDILEIYTGGCRDASEMDQDENNGDVRWNHADTATILTNIANVLRDQATRINDINKIQEALKNCRLALRIQRSLLVKTWNTKELIFELESKVRAHDERRDIPFE